MTVLGAVCLPQLRPERFRALARAADQAGLDELWLWEDCFWGGGVATAAAALAWTERLRVGVGLLPVPLRNVALTAMEIATLHRLFPGRVNVGVGHGVQDWMAQVGARVDSPVTLLREHLSALRALLAGEKLTMDGRYVRLDGVALDRPPAAAPVVSPSVSPAIFAGGTGPRTLRLSGEAADGTILTAATTPDRVREARRIVAAGRAAACRSGAHPLVVYLLAAPGENGAERLSGQLGRAGYENTAALGVAGEADEIAAGVRRWAEAGADVVVLQPTLDDPDPEGFVRFVAEEVRPLVP
jgi:alkanesulfonate monooxygenase SsuD/methylene tetrahydromethanopterin reductase-like flavin-dependent oxidoreductase (luciferase family)